MRESEKESEKLISKALNGLFDAREALEALEYGIKEGYVSYPGSPAHKSVKGLLKRITPMRIQLMRLHKKLPRS
jgi:hypothetical protein